MIILEKQKEECGGNQSPSNSNIKIVSPESIIMMEELK